jgi:hypothetical protein
VTMAVGMAMSWLLSRRRAVIGSLVELGSHFAIISVFQRFSFSERGQFLLLTTGGWVRERADASKSGLNQWRSELCRGLNPKLNLQLNLPIPMIGNADARCSRIWD